MTRFAFVMLLLVGCPRGDVQPPPPTTDEVCESRAECNDGTALCGRLRACVDGFCEAEASVLVPCP